MKGFDPPQPEGLVATARALVSKEGRLAVSRELVLHLKRNALCLTSKTEGRCEAGGREADRHMWRDGETGNDKGRAREMKGLENS